MAQLTIATEKRVYRVSPDDPLPRAALLRLLIAGQIVDELAAGPFRAPPHPEVAAEEPGFSVQMKTDGFFGIAGVALHCLSSLATHPYQVHLTVRATGYIPLELSAEIPQTLLFPNELPSIVELGQVSLHREPVLITGRVMEKQGNPPDFVPIAGATVVVTGIWLALPPPNKDTKADKLSFVAIRASLYSTRDSATATAISVTLTPVGGQNKTLRFGALSGALSLSLDNRLGLNLAGGDILGIDPGTAAEEFIKTTSIAGASTPTLPAEVRLAQPLRNSHRRDATVTIVTSQTSGPAKPLTRSGIPGDAVIFVDDLSGWDTATAVEIADSISTEYHAISRFEATTDQAGFYRLPPISRVAIVELEQAHAQATAKLSSAIDYTKPLNHVDFHI